MNRLSSQLLNRLACPSCKMPVGHDASGISCKNSTCNLSGKPFKIIGEIPVLIDFEKSVFSLDNITSLKESIFGKGSAIMAFLTKILPSLSLNVKGANNITTMRKLLLENNYCPRVLVIGGGELGVGMESIVNDPQIDKAEMDVYVGSRTNVIGDAHDIPFVDATFDGVIIQAVLQHVLDPWRVVAEIYRVLKLGGLVYSETAFMQSVRMGRFDFTRFTHLGHRRLFRWFEEIDSGAVCGPGMATAQMLRSYLLSWSSTKIWRGMVTILSHLLLFPLKYTDKWLIDHPAALDAASGTYFLGRSAQAPLSDKQLLDNYRGWV